MIPVEVLDQDTKLDLAVLRADEKSLPTVNFSLAAVKTGNKVYAVGSPLGMESSMSQGIVSNPSRIIQGQEFIQTNIAINSGNSGGPLFNASAQVIGCLLYTSSLTLNPSVAQYPNKINSSRNTYNGARPLDPAGSCPALVHSFSLGYLGAMFCKDIPHLEQ